MLAGLVTLASAGIDALPAAAALVLIGVLAACSAPWRFVVVDEGIALWFAFGRRRFLADGHHGAHGSHRRGRSTAQ